MAAGDDSSRKKTGSSRARSGTSGSKTSAPKKSGSRRTAPKKSTVPQRTAPKKNAGEKSSSRRKVLWWTGGGVVVLAGAYVGAAALLGGTAPADATIDGIDIGGQDPQAVRQTVETLLVDDRAAAPVDLVADPGSDDPDLPETPPTVTLDPAEVGLGIDVEATVDRTVGFSLWPADLWHRLTGDHAYSAVLEVDDAALDPALDQAVADLAVAPVDAGLTIEDGTAQVGPATTGLELDPATLRGSLLDEWPLADPDQAAHVPADTAVPTVTTAEARAVEEDLATPALAEAIPVTTAEGEDGAGADVAGAQAALDPAVLADHLTFEVDESGDLVPVVDALELKIALVEEYPDLVREPEDAGFSFSGDRRSAEVVPATPGATIDSRELAAGVVDVMGRSGEDRALTLELDAWEPELTTEEAEAIDRDEIVSEFSTPYTPTAGRDTNLRVGSENVSGTVVMPGETFSLNETLGQRTAANGYARAGVILNGEYAQDYGGGVSQVSTTLFNAAYFAGLQLDEHRAHSRWINRYPEGRETTLDWHTIDLKFTNDSENPIVLDMWLSGNQVHARTWGVKTVDVMSSTSDRFRYIAPGSETQSGPDCTPQSPENGWSITVYRTIRDHGNGSVLAEDQFTTTYLPVKEVRCED
ncbi:VanW family protein [Brevibacterium litoralis]|uniref:VanW family protein n=1 Tax=Brevibacterium litoralis TaxID=3138935 RepID=UPI0032F094A9